MIASGRYKESLDLLMMGCSVYTSASLYLLIAVASYRMDLLEEAEDALHEVITYIIHRYC